MSAATVDQGDAVHAHEIVARREDLPMHQEERPSKVWVIGTPPAPVLFELRRMGRHWFEVAREESPRDVPPGATALLRYVRDETLLDNDEVNARVPVLHVVCGRRSPLAMTRSRMVERFDIAEPQQRLALLARLATLGNDSERGTGGLAECVWAVQLEFAIHLEVNDLAQRLDVCPSTIARWCAREGVGSPEHILRCGKVRAAFHHIKRTGDSVADTARRLGFSAPSNLSKHVRKVCGCTIRELVQSGDLPI